MMDLRLILQQQKGVAAITAIIVMTVLGILGAAFVTLSSTEGAIAANYRDGVAAQYLAEAGAQWAIAQLKTNPSKTNFTGVTAAPKNTGTSTQGTYSVTVTGDSSNTVIKSKGMVNKSIRMVTLNVTPGASSNSVFQYAAFSKGDMIINQPQINGDIESNGKITVNSHAVNTVNGKAVSADHNDWGYSNVVRDDFYALTQPGVLDVNSLMIPMPSIPAFTKLNTNPIPSTCKKLRDLFGTDEWSGKTFTLTNLSSPTDYYYYESDYGMWNQTYYIPAGQSVIIYVKGNFDIGKDIKVDGNLTIYADKSIVVNGGSIVGANTSVIKLFPSGTFTINNGHKVTGGNITVNSTGNIALSGPITGTASSPINIYTSGEFTLNSSAQITGGTIKVISMGNMAVGGSISAADSSTVELYTDRILALNSGEIKGGTVTILANNSANSSPAISFNGGSINSSLSGSVSKVYARGNVALNNVSVIAGQGTGMLVSTGAVDLNGGSGPNTIIVAEQTVNANTGSTVAGIYTNGTINMNGATVNYSNSIIQNLGVISGSTTVFKVNSYSNH